MPIQDLEARLEMICAAEGVNLGPNTLKTLIECSGGDLRKAITFLQSGFNLQGSEPITPRMVEEMAGIIPKDKMDTLIECLSINSIRHTQTQVQNIMNEGYSGENILAQIHQAIIKNDNLSTLQKTKIYEYMSVADIDLVQGGDEHLQILNVMTHLSQIAS